MSSVTLKGHPVKVAGHFPTVGETAKDFTLVGSNLSESSLATYAGKRKVLNIFPSIDTPTCATSVRTFNKKASGDAVVLCISSDLPFAQARFCGAEGLTNVVTLSTFRSKEFHDNYGVSLADGPLRGLTARAVVVLDENNKVLYTELVPEIGAEPNYDAALAALTK